MNYSLVISAASAVIAASAFLVAWLNYRTSRKLPNENKLFEEKFRSYREVIAALNTAAAVYIQCTEDLLGLKHSDKKSTKIQEDIDDELDKDLYK